MYVGSEVLVMVGLGLVWVVVIITFCCSGLTVREEEKRLVKCRE